MMLEELLLGARRSDRNRYAQEISQRERVIEQAHEVREEAALAGALSLATGGAQLAAPRGRQRTPKPWLMSVLCRLGMHDGQWAYVAEGNCTQGRECERCGSVHARFRHRLEWRYRRERTCRQVRTCQQCDAVVGQRTDHQSWSETYVDQQSGRFREVNRCLRCGVVEELPVSDGD